MKYYYYVDNDQRLGPFTVQELQLKRIKESTLVWTEGLNQWTLAKDIEELKNIVFAEPPPIPKVVINPTSAVIQSERPRLTPSASKYDLTYKMEIDATFWGVGLFVTNLVIYLLGGVVIESEDVYNLLLIIIPFVSLFLRIVITVWVGKIAFRQNRDPQRWRWFAFILPSLALIIIGQLRKLNLIGLPPSHQALILFNNGKQLFSDKKYKECIYILSQAIELDRQNVECVKLRGLAYFKINNFEQSKVDFESLLKQEQCLSIANLYLGNIALNNLNRESAIEFWSQANRHDNDEAKRQLDKYHSFTCQYLVSSEDCEKKLGRTYDIPLWDYGQVRYEGGISKVDSHLKKKPIKVKFCLAENGVLVNISSFLYSGLIAIAYYEIQDIRYLESENRLELLLLDNSLLLLRLDNALDHKKSLFTFCNKYKTKTGKTADAERFCIEDSSVVV